jgi:hypothetical protein
MCNLHVRLPGMRGELGARHLSHRVIMQMKVAADPADEGQSISLS